MAYKLKGTKLKFVAEHIVSYRKMAAKKRLYIECDDKDSGATVYTYLHGLYGNTGYDKGFNWKDFTMVFSSEAERNKAYEDLNGAYSAYIESNPEIIGYEPDEPDPNNPNNGTDPEEPDDPETETTDWTTYIIIGAAALVIIILLLWNPKRK